jgi:DNA repair protein RecN (Recombination protein N)
MLLQLSIKNFAVIESVVVSFQNGFNVITGETGAGKSIIIDALGMLIGGRGSVDYVRHGADKAELEALFDVNDENHPVNELFQRFGIGASDDGSILIRRELLSQGKSISRINGQLVNLTMLKEIGQTLVNIHGQHEHQSLLHSDHHMEWLDAYGGDKWESLRLEVRETYRQYIKIRKELIDMKHNEQEWYRQQDLYQFQLEEIKNAQLKLNEEEQLLEEQKILANAEKISENLNESYELLYGDRKALDCLTHAISRLEQVSVYDQRFRGMIEPLQSSYYQIEDIVNQLRDSEDEFDSDPARLAQVGQRLDLIQLLKRKYGTTVNEILQYAEKIEKDLDQMENKDLIVQKLEKELMDIESSLVSKAERLSQYRVKGGQDLSNRIEQELKNLHMERARFAVSIRSIPDGKGIQLSNGTFVKITEHGIDYAEFLISANPGEPLKPLAKIASGGELSRIMLAMKTILADADHVATLIFDEVDTGVSGRAAQSIAEKLSGLANRYQVFSITHLPQVACMSDAHYRIEKKVDETSAKTDVTLLSAHERINELARMLGGVEVTPVTQQHAKEMLLMAHEKKEDIESRLHLA